MAQGPFHLCRFAIILNFNLNIPSLVLQQLKVLGLFHLYVVQLVIPGLSYVLYLWDNKTATGLNAEQHVSMSKCWRWLNKYLRCIHHFCNTNIIIFHKTLAISGQGTQRCCRDFLGLNITNSFCYVQLWHNLRNEEKKHFILKSSARTHKKCWFVFELF